METKDPNLSKTLIDTSHSKPNQKVENHLESDAVETSMTTENKGTTTLDNEVVDSEHVKEGDNPARQPDRRDQQGGTPFDGNVNDNSAGTKEPKSEEINERNRYATVDNAQSRVLNEDLK